MIGYKKKEKDRESFGTICYFMKKSVTHPDESCGRVLFIDDVDKDKLLEQTILFGTVESFY